MPGRPKDEGEKRPLERRARGERLAPMRAEDFMARPRSTSGTMTMAGFVKQAERGENAGLLSLAQRATSQATQALRLLRIVCPRRRHPVVAGNLEVFLAARGKWPRP